MVVRIKDAAKLFGIIIISCCAVFVCTLFLNFSLDLMLIKDEITTPDAMALYDAQLMTGKVICAVSGGCLLITSIITLFFYIKHYIDAHRKNLGILKALGYSNFKIASGFWVFGLSVFIGTLIGFLASYALMPTFYSAMNKEGIMPEILINFHFELMLFTVIIPSLVFSFLSVLYSFFKLRLPALQLMTAVNKNNYKSKKHLEHRKENLPFLKDIKRTTVKSRKSLAFFIAFSAFCYSAMIQMTFCMNDLASDLFAVIILTIGLILSFTTLMLAVTTVINSNTKTIAVMRVFGYTFKDCRIAILNGYKPLSYIGFLAGTIYQYALLKIMVGIVFKGFKNVPDYKFDIPAFFITLISFIIVYEMVMYCYSKRIRKISIKEIMLDNI